MIFPSKTISNLHHGMFPFVLLIFSLFTTAACFLHLRRSFHQVPEMQGVLTTEICYSNAQYNKA